MNDVFKDTPKHRRFGYTRVSSKSQESNSSLEDQKNKLMSYGIPEENIRVEVGSAADSIEKRPVLKHLINQELKAKDLLLVTKLDRCSRDTLSFLQMQKKLLENDISFITLDIPYSTDMAVNRLMATQLAAIATFENERRRERQRKGILRAQREGKYKGRKSVITPKLIAQVKDLKENKQLNTTKIAKITGKSRATIYKILKNELGYVSNKLVKPENVIKEHQDKNIQKGD